jgi:MFS transporter, OFA family, oxalate/formate antiporter
MAETSKLRRPGPSREKGAGAARWQQLLAGIVVMMIIAGALYVWPLLRSSSGPALGRTLAATENGFAAFILAETLCMPIEGWLGEHVRSRLLVAVGGALVLAGALAGARAEGVGAQTAFSALGGAGAGIVYGGTVARTLRRFTDRKARCLGFTAAACATVVGLALLAYATAVESPAALGLLVVIGGGQAIIILIATLIILEPPPNIPPPGW